MKKRSRKILAAVLAMVMLLSVSISALAAGIGIFPNDDNRYTIQPVQHYDTYTYFGDSITAGVNCADYYHYYNADGTYTSSASIDYAAIAAADHWDNGDARRVEGTYPAAVEDMVTADVTNHMSRIGYRSDELRILLDDSYYGDDLTPTLLQFLGATYSVSIEGWLENRQPFQQAAVDADLITLGIGSNDVLMTVWFKAIGLLYGENASLGTIMNGISSIAQQSSDPTQMLSTALGMLNSLYGTTKTLAELAQAMLEAEVDFRTNFKAITDRIYELNPDVDLYVVGIYNGAKEVNVSSNLDISVGKLGDAAFMAINNYIANICPNRTKYTYVDVWNITLGAAPSLLDIIQNVGLIGSLMTVDHPTETGHAEIAKEIRAVLPKVDSETDLTPKTTKEATTTTTKATTTTTTAKATTTTTTAKATTTTTAKSADSKTTTTAKATTKAAENNATQKNNSNSGSNNNSGSNSGNSSNSSSSSNSGSTATAVKRVVKKNPADGKWYCYLGDDIEYSYTGIARNDYGWWRIVDGEVDFDATGVYKNEYGWWRVENGKVNFDAQGIYKNEYGWWKTTNGKVTFDETGVFKNEYGWWYVKDSKVDFDFTGIASNEYGSWYIKDGKVAFDKSGVVLYKGKLYTIKDGKVV